MEATRRENWLWGFRNSSVVRSDDVIGRLRYKFALYPIHCFRSPVRSACPTMFECPTESRQYVYNIIMWPRGEQLRASKIDWFVREDDRSDWILLGNQRGFKIPCVCLLLGTVLRSWESNDIFQRFPGSKKTKLFYYYVYRYKSYESYMKLFWDHVWVLRDPKTGIVLLFLQNVLSRVQHIDSNTLWLWKRLW